MQITLQPLAQAVASVDARTPVGSVLRSAEWAQMPLALRQRAQFSAGVESARVLQRVQDGIRSILDHSRDEHGVLENRARLRRDLMSLAREEGLAGEGPDSGEITDIGSAARTDLIIRTQTGMAYGHAEWKSGQDPDALEAAPAWELFRLESRERPRDWVQRWRAAGGRFFGDTRLIALKTDPIWTRISRFGTPWPPFDFNSGMWVREVLRPECEKIGVVSPGQVVSPIEADFNQDMEASVRGLGDELRGALKELFGPQISVDGDRVRWNRQSAPAYEIDQSHLRQVARSVFGRGESLFSRLGRGTVLQQAPGVLLEAGAREAGVQVSAVAAGRKPLYHDDWGGVAEDAEVADLAQAMQRILPPRAVARAEGSHLFVYHRDALGPWADPQRPLWPQVRDHSDDGRWLGYGVNFPAQPSVTVWINNPQGERVSGFRAPRQQAEIYAAARTKDWVDATGEPHSYAIIK